MSRPDLNLLFTLNVLLDEGNVARAARRLRLSPSAMSRALARLRRTTGDPLLVRAGRGLVPTPRALELRERVSALVEGADAVLRPAGDVDLRELVRTFTLRASDGFVENFGAKLVARVREKAPAARLSFLQRVSRDSGALRDGTVDLEIGVVDEAAGPEVRARALFHDRFVGAVRVGHPLSSGIVTAQRYAAAEHVTVSRRGLQRGAADDALAALGLDRQVVTIVSGFAAALAIARESDLVATLPERQTSSLRSAMHIFSLPFDTPAITVSMLWHPRMDADPAHRWLRDCVRETCS